MTIVNAAQEHLDRVYELICELESEKLDKDKFSEIYCNNINSSNIYYVIAINESNIVGFASLHVQLLLHHCSNVGELQELIVSENDQSSGIGSALFMRIKELAVENNCSLLEVCCNKAREKSHQFYLKQSMKNSHHKFTYSLV